MQHTFVLRMCSLYATSYIEKYIICIIEFLFLIILKLQFEPRGLLFIAILEKLYNIMSFNFHLSCARSIARLARINPLIDSRKRETSGKNNDFRSASVKVFGTGVTSRPPSKGVEFASYFYPCRQGSYLLKNLLCYSVIYLIYSI